MFWWMKRSSQKLRRYRYSSATVSESPKSHEYLVVRIMKMQVNPAVSNWQQSLRRKLRLLTLTACVSPIHAIAAEFGSEIEERSARNSALTSSIQTDYVVQVLLSLVLVVGVIVLLSFLLKKINFQARTGSGAVRILSVVPIGAKDRLLLVAVGEEQLLLGSSPGSVQKLHTLDKPIDPTSSFGPALEERNFMSVLSSVRRGQQS
ncbi:MAG: flagellar biosynthetic protein FliO [SAR86 cluster bacterium]|uniref:Flagellar protein n=1 Tax=SAR86 cluster bacterium TaxID=2030880 RepID=A0A2A4XHV4_9GAMM|nr:MAG: flagellar biosynthetic protein FliO [SAR86 cluster bacterium]